ncbi:hypothetical protein Tco_0923287 [Tanacetum coccineum]|uniref:CCHC-type domain-containing protein n=1 Tax=Tanacetum coccineum TaxID=301880 RepID=A0ABQ5D2Z8_9ASTR
MTTMMHYLIIYSNMKEFASRAKRVARHMIHLLYLKNICKFPQSSRSPIAYYVTHPPSVVDYDEDYQGDAIFDDNEEVTLSTMDDPWCSNVGNGGRYARRSFGNQGESADNGNVQKETRNGNVRRILQTSATSKIASNVQCYNCNAKGHYAKLYFKA